MVTYTEFQQSRAVRIAGVCPTSQQYLDLTNESVRMLLRRGSWWGTVKKLTMCVYSNCIVWPRWVGNPIALNRCGHSIVPKNHWYQFNSVLPEDVRGFNGLGTWDGRCRGSATLVETGTTSVFNEIPCLNDRYIRFYPTRAEDAGKVITIFGIDGNGQVIRSTHSDGTYQDGLQLVLAIPYVQTSILVRRIDRVIKDMTDGDVFGYQFDGQTLYDLAAYQPSETLPEYRKTTVQGGCCTPTAAGCPSMVTALVKIKYIPIVHGDDLVLIDNVDAMADMMQALNKKDSYNPTEAEQYIAEAVHELNLQLRTELNLDQTPVRVEVYGTAKLCRARIGGVF